MDEMKALAGGRRDARGLTSARRRSRMDHVTGPFPPAGGPSAPVDLAAANLIGFDLAVISQQWRTLARRGRAASTTVRASCLEPRRVRDLHGDDHPNVSRGTVIRGSLYVDDFVRATRDGDELIAFTYSYRVG